MVVPESPASSVSRHYDEHLARIYAWMVGDFDAAVSQMTDYFSRVGVVPSPFGTAIDLGCGHGVQSIPLAKSGLSVVSIDNCQQLLGLLAKHVAAFPVRAIKADLLDFNQYVSSPVDVIVCMGDTITHLSSNDEVRSLVTSIATTLRPGGTLCVSFRDYVAAESTGSDRFIPVRSDDSRIHTCFLEYDTHVVHVHDLVYERSPSGWEFTTSSYDKLRLDPVVLKRIAEENGLKLAHEETIRGMLYWSFNRQ